MRYDSYEAEDFASDPAFVRWVRQPDAELDAFWNEWLQQHPHKAKTLREARHLVIFLQFGTEVPSSEEQQEVKQHVLRRISASFPASHLNNQSQVRWLSIAASVALLMIGSFMIGWLYFSSPGTIYQTAYSEQREILLPDGTQVQLNANSKLSIESEWKGEVAREVWLEGEAYFEVVKQPQSADGRFIVYTPDLAIEVLGTAFNVQARRGKTEVVLNEGQVALKQAGSNNTVMMEPGEKASLNENQVISKEKVNAERHASWKNNRLFFDNEPLRDIFLSVQDIHGYKLKVSDPSLLQLQFTGSCPTDDISILITAIAETFNLRVEREDNHIIFYPQQSTQTN